MIQIFCNCIISIQLQKNAHYEHNRTHFEI